MADLSSSPAKVILLAVQFATKAKIAGLSALAVQHRKTLRTEIILRIILTFLPESLEPSSYIPLLIEINASKLSGATDAPIDYTLVDEISNEDAISKVRRLRLLPLVWPSAPPDAPHDPLVLFLIHRAYRIDEQTGLISQVAELLVPFLDFSHYLRSWMVSIVLPLVRLNYQYHPQENAIPTLAAFEALDDWSGVNYLLMRTGKKCGSEGENSTSVGRDLRGLIGPWTYGSKERKRVRLFKVSDFAGQTVGPLNEQEAGENSPSTIWNEVFKWIMSQATTTWNTCVKAIEQWDGPSDVDLGGYANGQSLLEEYEQQELERRYARAALAAAYLIQESSMEALIGVQRILTRLIILLDLEQIPTLSTAASLLTPVSVDHEVLSTIGRSATHLRTDLMEERNILTSPKATSIKLLHALLLSAYLLSRAGVSCTVRRAGELVFLQDQREQTFEVQRLIHKIGNGPKGDDKYWIRTRNEILWLRDWGSDDLLGTNGHLQGRGIFGTIQKDFLEMELLKTLLTNTRYTLARSIYETSTKRPLSAQQIRDTVVSAAMNAYDNATNANKTRGGVKKCDEIIHAFPDTLRGCLVERRIDHLLLATHSIGQYRLVLKQGEPFTPVVLRVHGDPIAIIGKILDQNPNSYTKINDIIHIAEQMVLAGLTVRDIEGHSVLEEKQEAEQISIARKRVTSMCIDAALAEDDFETAYSYVMNRLSSVASEAQARAPVLERFDSGILAHAPPRVLDDWSWRAALQAGKYRPNSQTVTPTHLGNASGNLVIRRLEQRKDCLSQALRIAPPATLHEILNVFRRCEEELDAKIKEEAEHEAAWDDEGDQTTMPGGFGSNSHKNSLRSTGLNAVHTEEAPMSLFDLTRVTATKAQSSLSTLTMLSSDGSRTNRARSETVPEIDNHSPDVDQKRVRKRDQLRDAATGALANGIGWLINAPIPASEGR